MTEQEYNEINNMLLSIGSLVGIGIGTFISNVIHGSMWGMIIGGFLFIIGVISVKQHWHLIAKN